MTKAIATLTMNPALDLSTATPNIVPTLKLRCDPARRDAGGGGINVARTLHALGGRATALFPSGGPAGRAIEDLLTLEKVPFRAVPIAGDTRESFAVVEKASGAQYRFVLPGPELNRAEQESCLAPLHDLDPRPGFLVASGSLPPGVPACFHAMVAGLCRSLGIALVVDSSGPALAACRGAHAALLKPSLAELEGLAGRPLPTEAARLAAARTLHDQGYADRILVSLGAGGALLVDDQGARSFPAIAVPVRSTIGAGDAMVAATVLALAEDEPIELAVRWGLAAGAAALMRPGTQLARRADFERLRDGAAAGPALGATAMAV